MPYGPITVNSKTFNQTTPGNYRLSTLGFNSPDDEIRVRGCKPINNKKAVSGSITRVLGKTGTVNSAPVTESATISCQFNVPTGGVITAADVDAMALEVSELITAVFLNRFLAGES